MENLIKEGSPLYNEVDILYGNRGISFKVVLRDGSRLDSRNICVYKYEEGYGLHKIEGSDVVSEISIGLTELVPFSKLTPENMVSLDDIHYFEYPQIEKLKEDIRYSKKHLGALTVLMQCYKTAIEGIQEGTIEELIGCINNGQFTVKLFNDYELKTESSLRTLVGDIIRDIVIGKPFCPILSNHLGIDTEDVSVLVTHKPFYANNTTLWFRQDDTKNRLSFLKMCVECLLTLDFFDKIAKGILVIEGTSLRYELLHHFSQYIRKRKYFEKILKTYSFNIYIEDVIPFKDL